MFARLVPALVATLLLAGCVGTGLHAEKRDLRELPRLAPGTRLASPLARPTFPLNQQQSLRSPLRAWSRLGGRDLFFAPVRVNGRRADLLIDTGADLTGITADLAKRARVAISPAVGRAAFAYDAEIPQEFHVHWGRVDAMTLGRWTLGTRTIGVSDHAFFYRVLGVPLVHASGVLGMDVLRHARVTFDYARGTCTLDTARTVPALARSLAMDVPRQGLSRPAIRLRVNEQVSVAFLPDSGASGHGVLGASAWKRLGLRESPARIRLDAGGQALGVISVVRAAGEFNVLPLRVLADARGRVTLDFLNGRASLPAPTH